MGPDFATWALDQLGVGVSDFWAWLILIVAATFIVTGIIGSIVTILKAIRGRTGNRVQDKPGQSQENSPDAQQQHATNTEGHVIQARDHNTFNLGPPTPSIPAHWIYRSGCPQFRLSPSPSQNRIEGELRIFSSVPIPNNIEVKWEGVGTDTDWFKPRSTSPGRNFQLAYHMGCDFEPTGLDEIEVKFSVRFWWDNQQHGATWIWYLVPHSKPGVWEWKNPMGSGTGQPDEKDVWTKP